MDPKLVLHIGFRKTGSSALQELLSANRALLETHGIDYPATMTGLPAHQELAWALLPHKPKYITDHGSFEPDEVYGHFTTLIEANFAAGKSTLLSSEDLSLMSTEFNAIQQLLGYLKRFDPTIVFYHRDPIEYLVSNYQHAVLQGRETRDFVGFCFNLDALVYAWPKTLSRVWVAAFGRDRVIEVPYEAERFTDKSILADFLEVAFDVTLEDDPFVTHRSNQGVSSEATLYKLSLNRSDLPDEKIEPVFNQLRAMGTTDTKADFLRKMMSDTERDLLMRIFR